MNFTTGHYQGRESQVNSESQRRLAGPQKNQNDQDLRTKITKGLDLMTRRINRSDFKAKVLPNIEPLMQISLWLTRNGLDASRLMREALAEAYQTWNLSAPEESYGEWLRKILISRYAIGTQRHVRLTVPGSNDDTEILVENRPNTLPKSVSARQQSWLAGNSDEDVSYFEAIASLPDVCRSAMILTYLDSFSNTEITDLTVVQPEPIDSAPSRGRSFIREEFFEHLMDS